MIDRRQPCFVNRCTAMVVNAAEGTTSVPVPAGYAATDVAGNPVTSIPVNSSGQAIVEVKTGNGPFTSNQTTVYPQVSSGNVTAVGGNAGRSGLGVGSVSADTPVIVLRKL